MSLVRYESRGAIAIITLDRPPLNALSADLIADLGTAVGRAGDESVRAVVLTGTPVFAAGADIAAFKASLDTGTGGAGVGLELGQVLRRIELLAKPVIAAVRGYALGGGLELAMACDLRIATDDAKVGQPEVKLGIIPGAGGTQRLARLVGVGRARDLIYTGRMIDAAAALDWGLVDRVVSAGSLDDEAFQLAEALASGATAAIAIAKRVIADGWDRPLVDALQLEAGAFVEVFSTADALEGIEAFLAKRPPQFRGR